jgi:outer membrane protein assembly factor BamB
MHMPEMTGLDVQRQLATRGSQVPIIVVTADDSPEANDRGIAAGAYAFLRKPIGVDELLCAVNSATGEGLWKREIPGETRVEPVTFEGLVVVACSDGTIVAVKGARPEDEVWKYRLDSAPGPMTVAEGVIYVSGSDLGVYAIDARKGTRLWRQKLGSIVTGRIARVNGTVCAASREGRVSFLDAASGESLWTFDAQGPIQGGVSSAGSLLLFGSDDQSVDAFDLSLRSLAWRLKVKGKVRMAPVVGKGSAFFGNDEGVYSVELN